MNDAVYVYLNPADSISSATWVQMFRNYLAYAVEEQRRVGLKFIDKKTLAELAESDTQAVIIFCPILTEENLKSPEWIEETKNILELLQIGRAENYVFKLSPEPFDSALQPLWLKSYKRYDFALKDNHGKFVKIQDYSSETFLKFFIFKIFDISGDIVKAVLNKGNDEITEFDATRSVYLAEATPDLVYTRHIIKRELVRHGYKVYPDKAYPSDYRTLNSHIDNYLRNCALSIHLIGTHYPKLLGDKEISLAELQNIKAAEYSQYFESTNEDYQFKRIIWLPEDMKAVTERQKKWLNDIFKNEKLQTGADVIKCPLEELKDIIFDKLKTIQDGENEPIESLKVKKIKEAEKIYLIHSEDDAEDALMIKELLTKHSGCEVLTVNQDESQQHIIEAHKNNLIECNSVIFLSGTNNLKWLRSKVSDMIKMKEYRVVKDYKFEAVISSKFHELPGEPVFKNMMLINSGKELTSDALLPVLEKLN